MNPPYETALKSLKDETFLKHGVESHCKISWRFTGNSNARMTWLQSQIWKKWKGGGQMQLFVVQFVIMTKLLTKKSVQLFNTNQENGRKGNSSAVWMIILPQWNKLWISLVCYISPEDRFKWIMVMPVLWLV